MTTKDGLDPADPLPLFLTDRIAQRGIGNNQAVIPSRVFKTSILIATATAAGIMVLSARDPVTLFANVTASLVGNSGLRPGIDQSTPTIESSADTPASIQSAGKVRASPPTVEDAPSRHDSAASESADQPEVSEPVSEALFRQFQAWADEHAQANVRPVQPVQDAEAKPTQMAPAEVVENARTAERLRQKLRRVLSVNNARAEMRAQNHRKKARRTSTRSSAAVGIPEAEPRVSPDSVHIDGKPCNRACQSYMARP